MRVRTTSAINMITGTSPNDIAIDFGGALDGALVRVTFQVYNVTKDDPAFDRDAVVLCEPTTPWISPAYAFNGDSDASTFAVADNVLDAVQFSPVGVVEFTVAANTTTHSSVGFRFYDFSMDGTYDIDMLIEYDLGAGFVPVPGDETDVVVRGYRDTVEVSTDLVGDGLFEVIGDPVVEPVGCFWTEMLRATEECDGDVVPPSGGFELTVNAMPTTSVTLEDSFGITAIPAVYDGTQVLVFDTSGWKLWPLGGSWSDGPAETFDQHATMSLVSAAPDGNVLLSRFADQFSVVSAGAGSQTLVSVTNQFYNAFGVYCAAYDAATGWFVTAKFGVVESSNALVTFVQNTQALVNELPVGADAVIHWSDGMYIYEFPLGTSPTVYYKPNAVSTWSTVSSTGLADPESSVNPVVALGTQWAVTHRVSGSGMVFYVSSDARNFTAVPVGTLPGMPTTWQTQIVACDDPFVCAAMVFDTSLSFPNWNVGMLIGDGNLDLDTIDAWQFIPFDTPLHWTGANGSLIKVPGGVVYLYRNPTTTLTGYHIEITAT